VAIAAAVYAGYVAWFAGDRLDLGAGFASANGRIEGVEIEIAAKPAGSVTAVLVASRYRVSAGRLARVYNTM
jgi:HlyD family secretion protein